MIVTFVGHHGHDAENALSYDMKAAFDALKQNNATNLNF
jgi:hypothetical protein